MIKKNLLFLTGIILLIFLISCVPRQEAVYNPPTKPVKDEDCPNLNLLNITENSDGEWIVRFWEYKLERGDESADIAGWKLSGGLYWYACRKGERVGENSNYYYCGDDTDSYGIPIAKKTVVDTKGNIINVIERNFILVFNENKEYVKTICKDKNDS
ncbi:hypothetical protein HYU22_02885 [Candidatus Woesearchaeota archaeon]|nr:hypothetical protein [Candidatus Woesearchaeota archaeon]